MHKNHPDGLVDHSGQRCYSPPKALNVSLLRNTPRSISATAKTAAEKVAAAHLACDALLNAA